MSLILDDVKGFAIDKSRITKRNKEIVRSSGLDSLPWNEVLPTQKSGLEENESTSEETQDVKKLTKSEKKERKRAKKLNAVRAKEVKRLNERCGIVNSEGGTDYNVNEYDIRMNIKRIYSKITEHYKAEADSKILQYHSIAFYKSDLQHLLPEEWLNDNNISIFYEILENTFLKNTDETNYQEQVQLLFPSLIQLFLHIPYSSEIESILPLDTLKKAKLIFVPINFIENYEEVDFESVNNGDHWALAVLNLLDNKLYVYDSMTFGDGDSSSEDKLLEELARRLQSCQTILKSHRTIEIVKMKCDQQQNFDDCGVYTVMFTCYLINNLLFSEEISLDIANVKFSPLIGRYEMLGIIERLINNQN